MDPVTLTALITGLGGTGGVGALFIKVGGYKARIERNEKDTADMKAEFSAFKAAQAQSEKDLRRELLDRMEKVEDKLDKLILMLGKQHT